MTIVVAALAAATVVGTLFVAANWQRDIEVLMGMPPTATVAYLRTSMVSTAIFVLVLVTGRALRQAARAVSQLFHE